MLAPVPLTGQSVVVRVGDGSTSGVAPNSTVELPIVVDLSAIGASTVASISVAISWNSSHLSYQSAIEGGFGTVFINDGAVGDGVLQAGTFSPTGTTTTFTLATVTLQAIAPAGTGTRVYVDVTAIGDEMGQSLAASTTTEPLDLCIDDQGVLGDVTADDVINIVDAQQVARFSVGLPVTDPSRTDSHGDVTADDVTNIVDAQQIARYSVSLPTPGAPNIGEPMGVTCPPPQDGLDLRIVGMYLTQATQTFAGSVPLISGRAAFLRVFAQANETNTATPGVRVRVYRLGSLVATYTVPAPTSSVPTSIDEGSLTQSWNVSIPALTMETDLSVLADIDPSNSFVESDETNNFFPPSGTAMELDVRTVPSFDVTFVPVLQQPSGLLGDVDNDNTADYLSFGNKVYPVSSSTAIVHETYTFDGALVANDNNGDWVRLLSEINAMRVAEGTGRHYYGVVQVPYTSGIAGIGYIGWPTAVGWDGSSYSEVAAHEWGHNFGRLHVDCGGPADPDPNYPYPGGSIGVWGFDLDVSVLRSPDTYVDLMSYCDPDWISDYTYEGVMDYFITGWTAVATAEPQRSLLVWGRIGPNGIVLEPAFEVMAPPSLPERPGPYRLQGIDSSGRQLLDLTFEGIPVEDLDSERQFAFAVPLSSTEPPLNELRLYADGRRVERIRPSADAMTVPGASEVLARTAGEAVHLEWLDTLYPAALVRDAETGAILSFAHGGTVDVYSSARDIEVMLSDGVASVYRRVQIER